MAKSLFEQIVDGSLTGAVDETILNGVTKIGDYVFLSSLVQEINIPSYTTSIGLSSFNSCSNVSRIALNNGLISLGGMAFANCGTSGGLEEIVIPDSVTSIGNGCFQGCTTIKKVTIGASVSSLGQTIFSNGTGAMAIADIYFKQPAGMSVIVPSIAGMGVGMFYVKTARSMNVYTDNETIKNYDWASDNITPTFYHLDGTAW